LPPLAAILISQIDFQQDFPQRNSLNFARFLLATMFTELYKPASDALLCATSVFSVSLW